jgi:hypothetical protein
MKRGQIRTELDLLSPTFFKAGFSDLVYHGHDYRGPLWIGAYGTLEFAIRVIRRENGYSGKIHSKDELESYLRWWINRRQTPLHLVFSRKTIGVIPSQWIQRRASEFDSGSKVAGANAREICIYSTPLDNDLFLEIAFTTTEWKERSRVKWKSQADALREEILLGIQIIGTNNTPAAETKN